VTLFSTYLLNNVFHLISVPIWKFSNLQEILVHKKRRGGIEKAVAALLPLLYFARMAEPGGQGLGGRPLPPTALCVEMGFYVDNSWESRCNIVEDV
jgi:hypothetical protein